MPSRYRHTSNSGPPGSPKVHQAIMAARLLIGLSGRLCIMTAYGHISHEQVRIADFMMALDCPRSRHPSLRL